MPGTQFKRTLLSEWRKQRWILLAALSVPLLCELIFDIGWGAPKRMDVDSRFPKFGFLLLWMLWSSVAGTLSFTRGKKPAGDAASADHPLFSLFLKIFTGLLAAFLSGVILTFAIWILYRGGWRFDGYGSLYILDFVDLIFAPFFVFIPGFAVGAFLSSLSRRFFAVAAVSSAATVFLYFSVSFFWLRLDLDSGSWSKDLWILATLQATAIIILGIVGRIYIRRRRGRETLRGIPRGIGAIVLVCVIVSACFLPFYLQTGSGDKWNYYFKKLSLTGRTVLMTAVSEDHRRIQVRILPIDSETEKKVVLRYAYEAEFSPDSKSIVYFSQKGWFGLVSNRVSLRVRRVDGSGDRVLVRGFTEWHLDGDTNCNHGLAFSPDGDRVAMNCGNDLYIAGLDAPSLQHVRMDPEEVRVSRLVGFHKNGTDILLRSDFKHFNRLIACNPSDEKCRTLLETFDLSPGEFNRELSKSGVGEVIPGFIAGYDVESLKERLHFDPGDAHNYRILLSPDRQMLIYAVDTDSDVKKSTVRIHAYSLESGLDEMIASFPGKAQEMFFSPSGNRIAISFWGEKRQTAILQSGKPARSFEGWDVLGWKGEDEVVLEHYNRQEKRLLMAVGNTTTGEIRQF